MSLVIGTFVLAPSAEPCFILFLSSKLLFKITCPTSKCLYLHQQRAQSEFYKQHVKLELFSALHILMNFIIRKKELYGST
jgi:hypothetical protein